MKKADYMLILLALAAAAILYFAFYGFAPNASNEMRVDIYVDGELTRSEKMTADTRQIVIENAYGSNTIEISTDSVEMLWSDCDAQVCVQTGKVSKRGGVIACLPHRLLVILEGGGESEDIDAVTW